MDLKTDDVTSRAFATTQCLEVLHPVNDLASREIGALRQPCMEINFFFLRIAQSSEKSSQTLLVSYHVGLRASRTGAYDTRGTRARRPQD